MKQKKQGNNMAEKERHRVVKRGSLFILQRFNQGDWIDVGTPFVILSKAIEAAKVLAMPDQVMWDSSKDKSE